MVNKAKYDTRLTFVLALVRKGLTREEIVTKFVQKWGTSTKTADRVLKKARQVHDSEVQALEDKRQAELSEDLKSEIQAEIITETEIDLILSKMVRGEVHIKEYLKGQVVVRDLEPSEIIAAADKLYKRKGSYAPAKVAQTNPDGTEVEQKTTMSLSDALALLAELKK